MATFIIPLKAGRNVTPVSFAAAKDILFIQQVFEGCKRSIAAVLAVTAILDIQILTTFNAKTFAFGVVQGLDGNFQQGVFTYQGRQVNLCIIGYEQFRFADGFFSECI
jgi:hypothetical protein